MERLTKRLPSGAADYNYSKNCYFGDGSGADRISQSAFRQRCVEQLAAYEETGRTPEEVTALGKLFDYALEESKTLTEQNRQLMLERNYVMSIIADVRKAGKTWMCQYCAHCKGIVSGMADCDSKKLCVMPYSQFELKRSEPPEVENA